MKKSVLILVAVVTTLCFVASVSAATLKPGDKTTCNNAKSITFTAEGASSAADRTNANAVVWKSSNFTTVPVTLGPGGHSGFKGARKVGMSDKHSMGRKSVTFNSQPNFSRGDSIGDISGEVRITNTGTTSMSVSCK
tara:strand:- start:1115 stop:1525 length:411 start_codon:yes stop_codon:yes gene_type:complete